MLNPHIKLVALQKVKEDLLQALDFNSESLCSRGIEEITVPRQTEANVVP